MPTWSHDLPKEKSHMGFDLRRTPADKPLLAIVTSDNILVTDTHYWGGRTVPCERPDCTACNASVPYRTHVYISAFCGRSHEHFLFECTANAAKAFEEYRQANSTLRGCLFQASRPKGTKNGKVVIITKPADLSRTPVPSAPDVKLALCVIWRLPVSAMRAEHLANGSPCLRTDAILTNRMYNQESNAGEPAHVLSQPSGNGRKPKSRIPK